MFLSLSNKGSVVVIDFPQIFLTIKKLSLNYFHNNKIIILFVLFFITTFSPAFSQTNNLSGIRLSSMYEGLLNKTSILLNDNEPIELDNSFSISFDFSFFSNKYFGDILKIEDDRHCVLTLLYDQHSNSSISFIELMDTSNSQQINIPFLRRDLIRNRWYNLKITFDKNQNKIKTYINGEFKGEIPFKLTNQKHFKFAFGLKDLKDVISHDFADIMLKNILITENNQKKYFWSLNPFENYLTDNINGAKLKIINPNWVYEDHKNWRKLAEFSFTESGIHEFGVAYDSINSRLFINRLDNIVIYDLVTGKDSVIKFKSKCPVIVNDFFYDNNKKELYSYLTGMSKVSIYDLRKNEWIVKEIEKKDAEGHYYGSAKFSYPNSDDLYLLGGYGYYKVNNDLFKYNFKKKTWERIKLKLNEMTPRDGLAFGKGFKEGEYIIFGGVGNKTGNQNDGFAPFYDAYILNMKKLTLTKLKLPGIQKFTYFSLSGLYLNKKDSVIYFLAQTPESNFVTTTLEEVNLKNGNVEQVGNKFKTDRLFGNNAYLDYNKSTNEFITTFFDDFKVKIYAISYPPIAVSENIYSDDKNPKSSRSFTVLILSVFAIGFSFIYLLVRKKKQNPSVQAALEKVVGENYTIESDVIKNAIKLFGGFRIFDKDGKDISSEFSQKIKEIFLIILIRSFDQHRQKGMTSEELSTIIWPESSGDKLKSSRGVAISRIRKLLPSVEGIKLEFIDKLWCITLDNGAIIDYAEYIRIRKTRNSDKYLSNEKMDSLINILEGGEFLKGISYEWLDPIKMKINAEIVELLISHIQ